MVSKVAKSVRNKHNEGVPPTLAGMVNSWLRLAVFLGWLCLLWAFSPRKPKDASQAPDVLP